MTTRRTEMTHNIVQERVYISFLFGTERRDITIYLGTDQSIEPCLLTITIAVICVDSVIASSTYQQYSYMLIHTFGSNKTCVEVMSLCVRFMVQI